MKHYEYAYEPVPYNARAAVLEVLRSPEGQEILAKAIRRELASRK